MATFEVVFHGQVRPGVDTVQARTRIGQLFQVDERQLDMLFSGRRIVIKQGLDEAAADKYRQAIERAGALCDVQPGSAPVTPVAAPAEKGPVPRDEFMAAFVDVQAPALPLAELGADMQDSYAEHAPLNLDLSAFSLAPAGSDLEQLPGPRAQSVPDTGHLRLADD